MNAIAVRPGIRRSALLGNVLAWLFLLVVGVLWMVPFLWMVLASVKSLGEIYQVPPTILPTVFHWDNYVQVWTTVPFGLFFRNSGIVAVSVTVGQILTCSMAGYSFARLQFPGRDKIFLTYLGTLMIPFPVLMIPVFILMQDLHLVDNLAGLILPAIFSAWGTFLMRQFMLTFPRELEDAAKLDGCSAFGIYGRIFLPLSMPVIATLGIFTFLAQWNDFLWPLIMISSVDNKTLPLGLAMLQARLQAIEIPWQLVMAAATFSIIPVLVLFVVGQKYYVQGIVLTGLKG